MVYCIYIWSFKRTKIGQSILCTLSASCVLQLYEIIHIFELVWLVLILEHTHQNHVTDDTHIPS